MNILTRLAAIGFVGAAAAAPAIAHPGHGTAVVAGHSHVIDPALLAIAIGAGLALGALALVWMRARS